MLNGGLSPMNSMCKIDCPNNVLVQYLLYGNKELPDDVN